MSDLYNKSHPPELANANPDSVKVGREENMSDSYPRLFADADGVWRQDKPDRKFGIRWDEICGLMGYKLDCVTEVDTVLELEFEHGHFIELNSTWEGFADVVTAITKTIPGLPVDWFEKIETLGADDDAIVAWRQ